MKIKVYFEKVGVYATGLSPTLNIRDISDGSLSVEAGAMTEVGDGFYYYDFTAYDYTVTYSILCDGTSALAIDDDRYVPGDFIYGEVTSTVAGGASIVGLANQSLFMLGHSSIISMTEDVEAARLCNGRYGYIRDSVIRAYPWNCATQRVVLAQSADTPSDYDYKYALPTSPLCLRVLKMIEEEEDGYAWKVEGRWILTDSSTCNIVYLKQITDINEMDVLLREAIAARLAADICYALTGSSKQQERMWVIYDRKMKEARSVDAQEGTPDAITTDTFLDARE